MSTYNDSTIVSMKFLEHVRAKSGMYAFQLNNIQGLTQQLKEIVDNSVDEALDKNRIYPIDITFFVSRDKSTYQCLIQDHGRGIPISKLVDCYTKEFTSGKYRGQYGGSSVGTFGIGSKASAALAKKFYAFTKRDDGFGYLEIEKGVVKNSFTRKVRIDKDSATIGTTVLLQPDDTMFTKISEMFKDKAYGSDKTGFEIYVSSLEFYNIFKANAVITVRCVEGLLKQSDLNRDPVDLWRYLTDLNNFKTTECYKSDPSLTPRTYVMKKFGLQNIQWELGTLTKDPVGEDDPLGFDIDVFICENSICPDITYVGAVNGTPIAHPESSHILMLQDVIKDQLVENIEDVDAKAFFEAKYKIPLSGCISVSWIGAEFIGQDKTRFENRQFADCYRQSLRRAFKKLTDQNGPGIWDRLWELIKENFTTEFAKFSKRSLGLNKNLKNITYDLDRKGSYFNCRSQDNQLTELFITEGDSAAGRVTNVRDANTQAVLKLSGKPINAIRSDRSKLDKNAVYRDLSRLIGVAPTDQNLDNMRFRDIIILTDADPDGKHIVSLVLGILYRINKLILANGRVKVANPPLYSLLDKKHGTVYLRDEAALRDARISSYKVLFDIDLSVDGGKTAKHLNNTGNIRLNKHHDAFRDLCMMVEDIGNVLVQQADLLNIDYLVLEQLLHVADYLDENNVNTEQIKKKMMLDEVVWDKQNNVLVLVDKSMEFRIPLTRLQETIRAKILPKYEAAHWKNVNLFVTTKYSDLYQGQPCTYAMLYKIFKDVDRIYDIRRFKGLGEMSAEALKKTCVDKNTRCFYTIRDIGDVDYIFKMLDVDTDARKKLINRGFIEED